jgi:hypothetical protein
LIQMYIYAMPFMQLRFERVGSFIKHGGIINHR